MTIKNTRSTFYSYTDALQDLEIARMIIVNGKKNILRNTAGTIQH